MNGRPRYVLITPVRNGEHTIAGTVAAVRSQSVAPARWVIVDDGSSDDTATVVRDQIAGLDWVRLIRRESARADFAGKVHAFQAGQAELAGVEYDFIGNLDGDISFGPDYFGHLLDGFATEPGLGLAGGHVIEVVDGRHTPQRISPNSVAGAVQLFRRPTFDQIGGLPVLRLGGEDSAAEIRARRHGWSVATRFDLPVYHHGRVLGGTRGPVRAWFTRGRVYRSLGYDPAFALAMSGYRALAQPPYVIGGLALLAGYTTAALSRAPWALNPDEVRFLRAEQRRRLRTGLTRPRHRH